MYEAISGDDSDSRPFEARETSALILEDLNVQPQTLYDIASENLRKSYDLQPEQLQKVLQVSIKSITESLTAAQLALDNSDLAELLRAVHKMKGTLLSLGLTVETRKAGELEKDLHLDVEKNYQPPFDELKQSLLPLLSAVEK